MKASDLFVKCLEAEGVKYVFGVPGEENAHLMLSLQDSSIEFILTRHEQGAAFMADVYGRLTGEAGVCLGTLGPGATNLVTGVADGNMDRAPMVVITGQADVKRQHKESHQHMDVVGLFRPITKWASPILHPDVIPEVVRKAFKVATREKPGACHIELPEDIAAMDSETTPIPVSRIRRGIPDETIIKQAYQTLKEAKRPVILAGNGAIRTRASEALRTFAKQTGIGVMSTFMGKGAVARSSEQCLFTVGLQAKDFVNCALDEADLVIAVGYDLVEYHPRLWNKDGKKRILHIDFLPAEVDTHYRVETEVVGDIAHALHDLTQCYAKDKVSFNLAIQRRVREEMAREFALHKDDDTKGTIRPQKVLWDVREVMGPEDILLSDVGAHKLWIGRYYPCDEPNTCLISNGFCSMGFAFPGAIAASLVHPNRKILAICGDGGFLMNVQEMETARRLNVPIVVMVWDDGGYGLISWKQDSEFGRHTALGFGNPNWMQLAEAFGWSGQRVENARDLKPALEKAFASKGPCLISVPIDYRENPLLTERLGNIACPI